MKVIYIGFCLLMFYGVMLGQPQIYYPNGKPYEGSKHSIELISNEIEPDGRVYRYSPFIANGDDVTTVGFLLFTDSALWVLTEKPHLIDSAIRQFDKQTFFKSAEFNISLDAFIARGVLTSDFISLTMGEPSRVYHFVTKDGKFDRWEYSDFGKDFIVENGLVSHYINKNR